MIAPPIRSRGLTILKLLNAALHILVTAGLIWVLAARFDLGPAADLMGHASLALVVAAVTALLAANLLPIQVLWQGAAEKERGCDEFTLIINVIRHCEM